MRLPPQIRTQVFSLPALFLGVGLCVFAWGLRYKLSLYDPPHSASHNIPIAKLLSKDELPETLRPTGLAADAGALAGLLLLRSRPPGIVPALVFAKPQRRAFSPLAPLPSRASILESRGLHSFFFRPPPALRHRLFLTPPIGPLSSL